MISGDRKFIIIMIIVVTWTTDTMIHIFIIIDWGCNTSIVPVAKIGPFWYTIDIIILFHF